MKDLVKNLESISLQLVDLQDAKADASASITHLEAQQNRLVRQLVDDHGWGSIEVDGVQYLPFERHDGTCGLRKL